MLEVDDWEKRKLLHEATTSKIIGAAFEVHDQLGYGSLERVYQRAIQVELLRRGATAELEKRIQVHYKGAVVGDYDIDVLVDGCVAVEIKVATQYDRRDEAQLLNESKATGLKVGMLVNLAEQKSSTNASSSKSVFHPCSFVAE
jgi:GxxExxY protein